MTAPQYAQDTDNGRYYFHPGDKRSVPSITNVKSVKNFKAAGAVAAKECATYASKNRAMLATLDEQDAWSLVKGAPYRPDAAKNIASKNGDIVHGWIDEHIGGNVVDPMVYIDINTGEEKPSNPTARGMWRAFLDFEAHYQPEWFMSEFTVWNDTVGYAGTMDWAAWINGNLILADNKSGKAAYPDMALQLAAGGFAEFILKPDGSEIEVPKFDRYGILHVRPQYWELIPVAHVPEWWEAFKALKLVFDTTLELEDKTLLYAQKHQVRAPAKTPKPRDPRKGRTAS